LFGATAWSQILNDNRSDRPALGLPAAVVDSSSASHPAGLWTIQKPRSLKRMRGVANANIDAFS